MQFIWFLGTKPTRFLGKGKSTYTKNRIDCVCDLKMAKINPIFLKILLFGYNFTKTKGFWSFCEKKQLFSSSRKSCFTAHTIQDPNISMCYNTFHKFFPAKNTPLLDNGNVCMM